VIQVVIEIGRKGFDGAVALGWRLLQRLENDVVEIASQRLRDMRERRGVE